MGKQITPMRIRTQTAWNRRRFGLDAEANGPVHLPYSSYAFMENGIKRPCGFLVDLFIVDTTFLSALSALAAINCALENQKKKKKKKKKKKNVLCVHPAP